MNGPCGEEAIANCTGRKCMTALYSLLCIVRGCFVPRNCKGLIIVYKQESDRQMPVAFIS